MTRDEILGIVTKFIGEAVDDVDTATLDPSKSMVDYGVNSLDIVEVVSRSMRQLKVKIPRSELNKIDNIDGLVDLLHQAVQEKGA